MRSSAATTMRCSDSWRFRVTEKLFGLSAMVVAAEGARADAALTAGCSVSSSRLPVSVERPGSCAGTVVNSAAPADVPARSVPCVAVERQLRHARR